MNLSRRTDAVALLEAHPVALELFEELDLPTDPEDLAGRNIGDIAEAAGIPFEELAWSLNQCLDDPEELGEFAFR